MYGSQTRLGQLLDSISLGFQQTSLEILVFFFILFALLTIFVAVFFAQKRKAKRKIGRRSPARSEHRIDIGDTRSAEAPGLSVKLPEGSPVLLVAAAGTRVRGTIMAQGRFGTSVKVLERNSLPGKGVPISLYFHNSAGVFSFGTKIIDHVKDIVRVEQSSAITFHQPRRKYFRRKESLPVFVRQAASFEIPQESTLLDLSGGGASLHNPQGQLKKGDILELSFSPETDEHVLVARVLRVSRLGRVLHVKFDPLSESERKRIMTFIFAQSRRHGNGSGRRPKEIVSA